MVFRKGKYNLEVFYFNSFVFFWNIVDLVIFFFNRFSWGINLVKFKYWEVFCVIGGFNLEKIY